MSTKLEVLDELTKLEDKYEAELKAQVEKKVTDEIISKYGKLGKQVCAAYYKDETISPENDIDCPTCDKKAKLLIKKLKLANSIVESITDEEFSKYYESIIDVLNMDELAHGIGHLQFDMAWRRMPINKTLLRNILIRWITETIQPEKE